MLRTARLVQQMSNLFLAAPETAHAAIVAMLAPKRRVDMAVAIERRHEFVAVPGRSGRKFLGARDLEPNAFEGMR